MALLAKSKSVDRQKFTYDEDVKIIDMSGKETPASKIATELGRTVNSIRYRQGWLRKTDIKDKKALKKYHDEKGK